MSVRYVYKVTFPNGKIYVGKDSTESYVTYFGSWDRDYVERDFSLEKTKDFTIRKEILWSSATASSLELSQKETEFIARLEANNPKKGYNLIPKYDKE